MEASQNLKIFYKSLIRTSLLQWSVGRLHKCIFLRYRKYRNFSKLLETNFFILISSQKNYLFLLKLKWVRYVSKINEK